MSEFKVRILVSIIGLLLLSLIIYYNGIFINIFTFLLTIIGLFELKNAFSKNNINTKPSLYIVLSLINAIELYLNNSIEFTMYAILLLAIFDLLINRNNIMNVSAFCFAAIYVTLGFSAFVLISNPIFIGLIFVIAFSTDTFAYIIGINFGKHKLIADVSPNKSIEGSIGGIIGSVLCTIFYLSYFGFKNNIAYDIALGIIGSIIAQCGDLVASRIKRDTGIKDFSKLIPGHGGVLDRFDSVLLVSFTILIFFNSFYR